MQNHGSVGKLMKWRDVKPEPGERDMDSGMICVRVVPQTGASYLNLVLPWAVHHYHVSTIQVFVQMQVNVL